MLIWWNTWSRTMLAYLVNHIEIVATNLKLQSVPLVSYIPFSSDLLARFAQSPCIYWCSWIKEFFQIPATQQMASRYWCGLSGCLLLNGTRHGQLMWTWWCGPSHRAHCSKRVITISRLPALRHNYDNRVSVTKTEGARRCKHGNVVDDGRRDP